LYGQALAALDTVRQQFTWLPDARLILGGLQSDSATAAALAGRFMGLTLGVAGFAAALVTMLVLSFYLVLEAPALEVALLRLLPKQHRAEVSSKLRFIGTRFGAWVRGQMLVAFIMGTTATVAMHLLGMPYPFFIGGIVAITDFVPLLGGTLGAIPAIAIALFQPRWQLFAVLAFFILIQQIENYVLIPRIMSRAVRISPMLTIVALLIGGTAYGIVGAFIALPLAAALQVFAPLAIRLALGQYRELDAA
jgi:predicted PurR-regulated permease PerM